MDLLYSDRIDRLYIIWRINKVVILRRRLLVKLEKDMWTSYIVEWRAGYIGTETINQLFIEECRG